MRRLCEDSAVRWISEAGNLYAGECTQEEFESNLEIIRAVIRAVTWQSAAHVMAEEIERFSHRVDAIRAALDQQEAGHSPHDR